jgi:hypothetical protein
MAHGTFAQRLRSLAVASSGLRDEGFAVLVQGLPNLEQLDISVHGVSRKALAAFLRSPACPNLRVFRIGEGGWDARLWYGVPHESRHGKLVLHIEQELSQLRDLTELPLLEACWGLQFRGVVHPSFFKSPSLRSLRTLHWRDCDFHNNIIELANCPTLGLLRRLTLTGPASEQFAHLLNGPLVEQLDVLDLSRMVPRGFDWSLLVVTDRLDRVQRLVIPQSAVEPTWAGDLLAKYGSRIWLV